MVNGGSVMGDVRPSCSGCVDSSLFDDGGFIGTSTIGSGSIDVSCFMGSICMSDWSWDGRVKPQVRRGGFERERRRGLRVKGAS